MLKIRWSRNHLIFNMGRNLHTWERWSLYWDAKSQSTSICGIHFPPLEFSILSIKRNVSVCRCHLISIGTPITKMRQSHNHLIFIMRITIPDTFVLKWYPVGLNEDNTYQNAGICLRQSHNVATLLTLVPETFHPELQIGWIKAVLTRGCCHIAYPSKRHLKLKSCKISFPHNLLLSCQIVFKFCTEHGSITAVLCTKFKNNSTNNMGAMREWNFMRFEFNMRLDGYSTLQQPPECMDL